MSSAANNGVVALSTAVSADVIRSCPHASNVNGMTLNITPITRKWRHVVRSRGQDDSLGTHDDEHTAAAERDPGPGHCASASSLRPPP